MTLKELYIFGKKNLPEEIESLILCEEFFGTTRQDIIMNGTREVENAEVFLDAVKRRQNGEPLQYILGFWDFDDLRLTVKDGVLVPREDTMVLVNSAIEYIQNDKMFGLDLCSGTGAVALSIANNCENVNIEALELFDVPLSCLEENVKLHGNNKVSFKKADIFCEYHNYKDLDFIVSNPPYIETKEIETLQIEVQNEPHTALDGGIDGLDFYKCICQNWSKCLKKGGLLSVEIGETQAKDVSILFEENGFTNVKTTQDLNGNDRVVSGIYE